MSIQSQIDRIKSNLTAAYDALAAKGVEVGGGSDKLAEMIGLLGGDDDGDNLIKFFGGSNVSIWEVTHTRIEVSTLIYPSASKPITKDNLLALVILKKSSSWATLAVGEQMIFHSGLYINDDEPYALAISASHRLSFSGKFITSNDFGGIITFQSDGGISISSTSFLTGTCFTNDTYRIAIITQ